jgi:hypothetical protein
MLLAARSEESMSPRAGSTTGPPAAFTNTEVSTFMAIRRIDYTVYPPEFKPGESPSWEFGTFTKAKRKARALGIGALVYRNFNQTNKQRPSDWWGDKHFWRWTGSRFQRRRETFEQVGRT